jgi:Rho-binding antiterminator
MTQPTDYTPINCNFYDELEALATLRKSCVIEFEQEGQTLSLQGVIVDLWNLEKVEYLKMQSGEVIRLDKLLSVDGKRPGNYC